LQGEYFYKMRVFDDQNTHFQERNSPCNSRNTLTIL